MNALRFASFVALGFASRVVAAPLDVGAATNATGLAVFRQLGAGAPAANLAISPYSIEAGLAMALAGADGATRQEMAHVLHLPDGPDAAESVDAGFEQLRMGLDRSAARGRDVAAKWAHYAKRHEPANRDSDDEANVGGIEWRAANRLFGQSGYTFRESFLGVMANRYAAPFEPLDFRHAAEPARASINNWVLDQTKGRIVDLVPAGGIGADTRLVLVNALYLKAAWADPFEPSLTKSLPFHRTKSDIVEVPTMLRGGHLAYEHRNGVAVVGLDYVGSDLQFLVILPDEETSVHTTAGRLSADDFQRWAKPGFGTGTGKVILYLPRFRIHAESLPLGRTLRALGMRSAFDEPRGSANFDRIAPRNLTTTSRYPKSSIRRS